MELNQSDRTIRTSPTHCIVAVDNADASGDLINEQVAQDLQQSQYRRPPINSGGLLASTLVAGGIIGAGAYAVTRYVADWTPLIFNGLAGGVCGLYGGAILTEYVTGDETKAGIGASCGLMAVAKLAIVTNLIPVAMNSANATTATVSGLSGSINGAITGSAVWCHRQMSRHSGAPGPSDTSEQP